MGGDSMMLTDAAAPEYARGTYDAMPSMQAPDPDRHGLLSRTMSPDISAHDARKIGGRKRRRRYRTVGFEGVRTRPEIYFRVVLVWLAVVCVVIALWFFWPERAHEVVKGVE